MLIFGCVYITKNGCKIEIDMLYYGRVMVMRCENEFCIYQEQGECILDDIKLDIIGQCTDCIYVNIPEEILENFKSEHRKRKTDLF